MQPLAGGKSRSSPARRFRMLLDHDHRVCKSTSETLQIGLSVNRKLADRCRFADRRDQVSGPFSNE
jgi:hypothetical protein